MIIKYKFVLKDGSQHVIEVDLDRASREPELAPDAPTPPDWTALEFRKCMNCPLKPELSPRCPTALDLAPTVSAFARIISHERAEVIVETPQRVVGKQCQVQDALSSVVALIMASRGVLDLARAWALVPPWDWSMRTSVPLLFL